jgi:hypothetical protein
MFKLRFRIEYILILFLVVSMILSAIYTESLSCLPMKTVINSNSSNHTKETTDSKQYSIDSSCNFSISPSNVSASYPHQTHPVTYGHLQS